MASLEDSILKKNVPGRYTSWKDDQDDKLTERQNKKLGPLTCINQGDGGGDSVDDDEIDEDGHGDGGQEDDNNGDDVDDEEFMKQYREKRIQQLKEEHALKQQQKHQNHRPRQQQHQQQEDHHEIQEVSSGSAQAGYIIVDAVPEIDGIEYVNMVNEQQQQRLQQASTSGDNNGDNGNDSDNSLVILLYHDLNDDITSKLLSYLASICLRNHTAWTKRNKVKKTQSARNASRQAQQKFPMICRRLNSNATSINIDPIVLPAILIHQNGGVLTHNLTPAIEHLSASSSSSSSPNNNFTQSDVYELLESCNVPLYYNLHDCNDDDDDDDNDNEEE